MTPVPATNENTGFVLQSEHCNTVFKLCHLLYFHLQMPRFVFWVHFSAHHHSQWYLANYLILIERKDLSCSHLCQDAPTSPLPASPLYPNKDSENQTAEVAVGILWVELAIGQLSTPRTGRQPEPSRSPPSTVPHQDGFLQPRPKSQVPVQAP